MNVILKIWRQKDKNSLGGFVNYKLENIDENYSFIEVLNILNIKLQKNKEEPIVFDCDCLEGICGVCSLTINGQPHGPETRTTACQTHMRIFKDGDEIVVEPFRAKAFPVLKDLSVDRTAFDKIIQAGGYISVDTGGTPDANEIPIPKKDAETAMDAAECIGCGACAAACNNSSAMLFTAAKVSQLASLPQGKIQREKRVLSMVKAMDDAGFGNCTNHLECEAACPKGISIGFIAKMNGEFIRASTLKIFGKSS